MTQVWAGAWFLAFCIAAGQADAQSVARSFDGLRDELKTGHIVIVVDETGDAVWGRVDELSSGSLSLFPGERVGAGASFPTTSRRMFSESAVIEIRRSDSEARRGAQLFSRPARSFADLSRVLKAGDRVTIKETDGRVSRGVVTEVSPTQLTLRGAASAGFRRPPPGMPLPVPPPRLFQADRVVSVARGGDSPWTGAAIGAAVGAALAVASVTTAAPQNASDAYALFLPLPAIGAGIGFLGDWATNRPRLLWSAGTAGSRARAQVTPILGRDAKGVSLSLQF